MNCCNDVRVSERCPYHSNHNANLQKKSTTRRENIQVSKDNIFLRECSEMSGDKGNAGCNGGQETRLHFHSKDGGATASGGCAGV